MNFTYILHSALPKTEAFSDFGFEKSTDTEGQFVLKKALSGDAADFFVLMTLSDSSLIAEVFDSVTGEKYALFDNARSHGSFVASMREKVQNIIEEIRTTCFISADLKEKYIAFLKERFGAQPDFPWADTPDFCVFRAENQKWFALIMKIKYKQLGLTGDEKVWVVNMKADADKIASLIDKKSIFPAWHMNKKHWITILLTAATDFDRLCALTERSFELVR